MRDSQNLEPRAWSHCVDTAGGYDVQYPSDWHTASGIAACRYFDPEAFTVPADSDFVDTALRVDVAQQSFDDVLAGLIDRRFAETELREQVTIGGKRAFRLELVATGEGLADKGTRTYGYVIRRDSGPPVVVTTSALPGERIRYRDVVDHAAQTLRPFAPQALAVSGLPVAVEQTHTALLAAAEAHDEDALRGLIDPQSFRYTFGENVPGGAIEFWRKEKERSGTDPIDALAKVLRLPYVLSQGIYVWPFAYDKEPGEMSEYERNLLRSAGLTSTDADGVGYLGWRAGIRPDGRWVFFVAGD